MVKKNACVFISGQGSNLKNLIKRSRDVNFPINIKLIISDNKKAFGIMYAKKNSIPYTILNTKLRNYENKIFQILKKNKINFICLAGYMKIISKNFIEQFRKKIINIHPSLLPKFKGLNTFSRVLKNNEIKTGCTVHYVDEKLDNGLIINQKSFYINSDDNEASLKLKTQKLEYQTFPEAIIQIFRNS
jgi:formyltetrahydrofolate-dependent phosphoribosylglycinamide formyltransferase